MLTNYDNYERMLRNKEETIRTLKQRNDALAYMLKKLRKQRK